MTDRKSMLVSINGRVQGVSFRAWTCAEARQLGVTGWVRNEPDGSVTALIAGPEARIAAMLERLRRGPPGARVSNIVPREVELEEFAGFTIAL